MVADIKMKTALITGVTGQDGAYLAQFLLKKQYKVFGTYRRLSTPNFWRLDYLGVTDKINFIPMDILDSSSIYQGLKSSNPDEVYHLAAQSFVGASFDQPLYTSEVTGLGVTRILEEINKINKKIKFYQASSSEMYGNETSVVKNEKTYFQPASPYGIAKLYGYWMVNIQRKMNGLFACNGILFNHESPLRGLEFVTRKISNGVARISLGLSNELLLGNLSAKRDWGFAPEYVEGMWKILQQKKPDDYVLATNTTHSVKEFVDEACNIAGVSIKKIKTNEKYQRPYDVEYLKGDYSKAKKRLGWSPKTDFKNLVKIMVMEDMARWERWLKKEYVPWDAIFVGNNSNI